MSFSSLLSLSLVRFARSPAVVTLVVCHSMSRWLGCLVGVMARVKVSAIRLSTCLEVSASLLSAWRCWWAVRFMDWSFTMDFQARYMRVAARNSARRLAAAARNTTRLGFTRGPASR